MKIKDIDLVNISRFRAEHMGMAMLFVILFHVGLPRWSDFYGLRRMGNLGVVLMDKDHPFTYRLPPYGGRRGESFFLP